MIVIQRCAFRGRPGAACGASHQQRRLRLLRLTRKTEPSILGLA